MKNMKSIVLIFCLVLFLFMISCTNTNIDTGKAEHVFNKESISKFKDYDKRPVWTTGNDIINKLDAGKFTDIEKYIDYLVSEKPYSVNGTRLLEELYQYVAQKSFNIDMLDKWCTKEPPHHSAFIFRGNYYINLAWTHRGGGLGHTVSEDGLRHFYENLLLAEKDFNKAWSMNPADPNSAASMPIVCTGLRRTIDEMDIWFNRAVTADPVTYSAYANKQNHIRPKWNGSKEKDLAFAEYCYNNAPAKSVIHEIMLDYHIEKAMWEGKDPVEYFNDPSIKAIIDDIARKTLENFPDSVSLRSRLAEIERYKGNYLKSVEILSEILEKEPDNPDALLMRAMLYSQHLGKPDLAKTDIERSLKSSPPGRQIQIPVVNRKDTDRIPEETLSRYAGTYQIGSEENLVIALFKTRLVFLLPDKRIEPLFPESELKFYNPIHGKVEFFKDDSDKVTHLILTKDGVEKKAMLISDSIHEKKEITLSAEMLSQYVGSYQLTPYNVVKITMESNQLFAQSTGYIKKAISPESESIFFYRIVDAQLEFLRDENGKVSHIVLTQGTKVQKGPRI
ncbi:MAG: DUF3471 domain-containing protein [Deltaproteobacteria bacterium]|nr:DUF3471 domain-containing protein [Deltaproteobacteria bacterium]